MKEGASIAEVAYLLNVHRDSLNEWQRKYPDFSDALKKGQQFSEGWWLITGRLNVQNSFFNSGLWYMNMKNRFGWKDRTESNHNINVSHEHLLKELE